MATLACSKTALRVRASVTSVLAASGRWRCESISAGEFIYAGGGSDSASDGTNHRPDRAFPGPHIGTEPRAAGDIVWRVFRHLRRDAPDLGYGAVDDAAAIGARR